MVKDQEQDSLRTPAEQGVRDVTPEPNKMLKRWLRPSDAENRMSGGKESGTGLLACHSDLPKKTGKDACPTFLM